MSSRRIRLALVISLAFLISGCDPKELVERKVPAPIRNLLSFSGNASKTPEQIKKEISLTITQPSADQIFAPGTTVKFLAKAGNIHGKPIPNNNLSWQLKTQGKRTSKRLGTGLTARSKLKPGKYRIELNLNLPKPLKGTKTVSTNFRVAYTYDGRVVYDGLGLKGVELTLKDVKTKQITATAKSDKEGNFHIEIPKTGKYLLSASKAGYGFHPLHKLAEYSGNPDPKPFRAAKAQITDIRLTNGKDSDEIVKSLCPMQKAYVKMRLQSESQITSIRVELIPADKPDTKPTVIGEILTAADILNDADPNAPIGMPVEWPNRRVRYKPETYSVTVMGADEKGNKFAAVGDDRVLVDITHCIDKAFAEAFSMQKKGDIEEAAEAYKDLSKLLTRSRQTGPFEKLLAKRSFNLGLINLHLALKFKAEGKKDDEVDPYLNRAVVNFSEVMQYDKTDAEAVYLRAVAQYLRERYENAKKDCKKAVRMAHRMAKAHRLLGRLALTEKTKESLAQALDAFTASLDNDPDNAELRKARSAVLKLDVETEDKSDQDTVDISSIPLMDAAKSKYAEVEPRK